MTQDQKIQHREDFIKTIKRNKKMRNRIIFLFLNTILIVSCNVDNKASSKDTLEEVTKETKQATDTFNIFTDLFQEKPLPIVHDETFLMNYFPNKQKIDTSFIKKYISVNKLINNRFKLFDVFKYYPVQKFYINEKTVGIIYLKSGSAGGKQDFYFLNIYSKSGELLYDHTYSKIVADCSFQKYTLGRLEENLMLTLIEKKYEVDCDTEKKVLINESDTTIIIDLNK